MKVKKIFMRIVLAAVFLSSCSRIQTDDSGCFRDFETAVRSSKKTALDILVIATMEGDDQQSSQFLRDVVRSPDFRYVTDNYSVVIMDFSNRSFDSTVPPEGADRKSKRIARRNEAVMKKNALTSKLLNISVTPSFCLMTKDGCFAANVEFTDELSNPHDFLTLLSGYGGQCEVVNALAASAKRGSSRERLEAINELYDSTEAIYRPFLRGFVEDAIKLSSGNAEQSGKFLMARADISGTEYFLGGNALAAVDGYVRLAKKKSLAAQYRQQAWYMAGYLLALADSSQYETVLLYLSNAVQSAPDSEDAQAIRNAINQILGA